MSVERVITTPADLSEEVLAFTSALGTAPAGFVPVEPAEGAIEDQPFHNVIVSGGLAKPVFGWVIWELTGFWFEASRHAVIERDNALLDITPPIDGETRILFVRDDDWAFDYLNPKPNRRPARHLLTDDADVIRWAKLADEVDTFKWRHTVFKNDRSELVIPEGKDTRRMQRLQRDYNAAAEVALAK